jgi:glutathione S-transferase
MAYIESELGKHTWFSGAEFTAADIQMSFALEALSVRGPQGAPNIASFLQRIHARPAYQRALQKGGPYELMR